jgi:hypothetical protein
VLFVLFQSCRVQNLSCRDRLSIGIGMQGRKMAPWISISQHCCRFIEALLLHGETRPLTCLPARATSAASDR